MINRFPEFPAFKLMTLSDRQDYEQFYEQFDAYSDLSFYNLWVWFNASNRLAVSRHNGNLIIRIDNSLNGGAQEYTILGKHQCERTFARLLRWQRAMGLPPRIVMVPKVVIDHAGRHAGFKYQEDIDNQDYIYDVEKHFRAEGHEYAGYRRALSYFARNFGEQVDTVEYDLADIKQRLEVINNLHTWDTVYRQDKDHAQLEGAVLDRCMRFAAHLPVKCLGLRLGGRLQAFAIYQLSPQGNIADFNHAKANNEYRGIADVLFSCVIAKLHELGIQFVNFEQDLGDPGMRAHKQSLRPCGYLKRYTITP